MGGTVEEYLAITSQVKAATGDGNIHAIYQEALQKQHQREEEDDSKFASAEKDFEDLHKHVKSNTSLLDNLETFLSTFQNDLQEVSGHISELQQRSRLIDARLQARKALQLYMGPAVSSIIITPQLINVICDTPPSEKWNDSIKELEEKLLAIRAGPPVAARKDLEEAAENLRLKATDKIRKLFIDLFMPFRTSVSSNLQTLQSTVLIKYRPLYAFLQKHAARQAHEVQKAYVSTAAWYYETGFRRYTRALEKIRIRSLGREDMSSNQAGQEPASLTAAMARNMSAVSLPRGINSTDDSEAVIYSRIEGPPVILACLADNKETVASSEALFRCISLVLADNAASEYSFIAEFFGRPIDLPTTKAVERGWDLVSHRLGDDERDTFEDSASVITTSEMLSPSNPRLNAEKAEKLKRSTTDHVWRQVMEPVLEYSKNFVNSTTSTNLSPTSSLAMLRLNDLMYTNLVEHKACPHASMDSHLMGIRLQLWPQFQKEMGNQIEAVKKLAVAPASGLFGGKQAGLKDATLQKIIKKYISTFNTVIALSEEHDEDMVFSSILRLRNEVQKLLVAQAGRIADKSQSSSYLSLQYEALLAGIAGAHSSHQRAQAETAHFKELLRKT